MKRLKDLDERPSGEDFCARRCMAAISWAGALMLWHIYGILVQKATIVEV